MKKLEMTEVEKIAYSSKKRKPFIIDICSSKYLTFTGYGHPNEEMFQQACEALFSLAYIIKFKISRKKYQMDYQVYPLEVSWNLCKEEDVLKFTWLAMIKQPDDILETDYQDALAILRLSKPKLLFERLQFSELSFGKCVQCFHKGDYEKMNDTMHMMQDYAESLGYHYEPFTHDVYLNDSRKTKVENLATIMRIKLHKKNEAAN